MLTRREKLLNRPWQLRRYNNHRKKVLTALPAIDFGPPTERRHVTCKLKKLQWEEERRHKVEEDNFKLLQRMGTIMKKNRLENHWVTPPPDFLGRVGIYHRTRSPTPFRELQDSREQTPQPNKHKGCVACTPEPKKVNNIPEERVPWSPPRGLTSRRRSSSLLLPPALGTSLRDKSEAAKTQATSSPRPLDLPSIPKNQTLLLAKSSNEVLSEKSLELRQGPLKLTVNFPLGAEVKIVSGQENKIIQRGGCDCKILRGDALFNSPPTN